MKNTKVWFLFFVIPALLLSITACNQKDNGVAPNLLNPGSTGNSLINELPSIAYINDRFSNPGSGAIIFASGPSVVSRLRANTYGDPRGENLALRCGANLSPVPNYTYGWGPAWWQVPYPPFGFNHTYFVDGNPSTGAWFTTMGGHPLLMTAFLWDYPPTPFPIGRFYAVTQGVQSYQLLYMVGWDWFIATSGTPIPTPSGSVIDVTLDPPIMAVGMGVALTANGGSVGLMEFGFYGPASKSIRITSPADGAQFMVGENIQFTSSTSESLHQYQWFSDNVVFGNTPSQPTNSASYLTPGVHTIKVVAQKVSDGSEVSDSIKIEVLAGFKIEVLGSSIEEIAVSYRAAKTKFQAIGYRVDGSEAGLASVDWEIQGGEVVASEQLRMGVLSHLGQVNTRIGNIENSPVPVPGGSIFPILDSPQVTFHSFLPGNITLAAKKGTASDSVAIRIKKPAFKVNVYPVGDVDTSIFATWAGITRQVWEKEGIIRIESITMQSPIPNVIFPASPLAPPYQGAEASMPQLLFEEPNLLNPLVYDCLLGHNSGFFNVPRQSGLLLASREPQAVNVFHVFQPWSYFVRDRFTTPPTTDWYPPEIYAISSREHFVILEVSGAIIESFFNPYPIQYSRFLAAGVGRVFGLIHAAEWLGNLMDLSPIGGLVLTPEQYITALNYRNDNPQNLTMIWEE